MRATRAILAGLVGLAAAVSLCGCCGANWNVWPPQTLDADGDGVCNKDDACPGFDDRLDADGDGVPDGCDKCRGNDAAGDADGDGVCDDIDPCPLDNPDDADGDGVCDSRDACPGFDDRLDADGDGVPDGCDACPGFDDRLDADGDGVPDGCDACPGHDDRLDADGDGVPDGCDLNVSAVGYGSVSVGGGTATAAPAERWAFAGWTLDGAPLGGGEAIPAPAAGDLVAAFRFAWSGGVPRLEEWLGGHPAVAGALVWEGNLLDPPPLKCGRPAQGPWCGEVHRWPWPGEAQDSLFRAFERAFLDRPSGVSDAPPNMAADAADGDAFARQEYSPGDARAAFMAYAANSLAVEIRGLVPWSILDGAAYGPGELAVLLDSRKFFGRQPNGNYSVSLVEHGGMSTMSAPETAMAFLRGEPPPYAGLDAYHCRGGELPGCDRAILSGTRAETIARTIHWFRLNAVHFVNHWWYGNTEAHWQYRGYTPAVRLMTGTARTAYAPGSDKPPTSPDVRTVPRTAGCWGTAGFMRTVLRAANIPMVLETAGGHALPSFPTEARTGRPSHMSHGDDPYNMLSKTSEFPSYALLMEKGLWESWFRPPPPPGAPPAAPPAAGPTNEEIEDGFLDGLPRDADYCGGDPGCGHAPPPDPGLDPEPGGPAANTPDLWVGGRPRALALSWMSWYVAKEYCDGGRVPADGAELSLRNWSMADLAALDCSALPETGRADLRCHGNFFEYLDEAIDGAGGCGAVGPGSGRRYYAYGEMAPMP